MKTKDPQILACPAFEARPEGHGPRTCNACGLSWDDGIITSMTPAPSARCPFEAFHDDPEPPPAFRYERYGSRNWAVYEGDTLVVVAVYKKGAKEVIRRLTEVSA